MEGDGSTGTFAVIRIQRGSKHLDRPASAPHVLFLGSTYAGHRTRFENLKEHVAADGRVKATFRAVTGWHDDGRLERLPFLPTSIKGRTRALLEASSIARFPRPDAIWTSCREELAPFAWAQVGNLRRPLVLELDATDRQLEAMAPHYFGRRPHAGLRAMIARAEDRVIRRGVTRFVAWSQWAAEGLRDEGVPESEIVVLPPGIDLALWQPSSKATGTRPLRLLFVGGDFERKGGDLLVDAARRLADEVEVTLVTREDVEDVPANARVVRAGPNSAELRGWYDWADVFVLPTRAECFGIAIVEAMAAGLPAIVGDAGGVRDIVDDGVTGRIIAPSAEGLLVAIEWALGNREALSSLGARGRAQAEIKFDGARNDRLLLDLLVDAANHNKM